MSDIQKRAIDHTYANLQIVAGLLQKYKVADCFNDERTKSEIMKQLKLNHDEIGINLAALEVKV